MFRPPSRCRCSPRSGWLCCVWLRCGCPVGLPDGDLVGSDEDVFDEQAQVALAVGDGCGGCLVAQAGEEVLEVVGEFEVDLQVVFQPPLDRVQVSSATSAGTGISNQSSRARSVTV